MAVLAALCKPHSASKQKLSTPVHSTLLDDFGLYLLHGGMVEWLIVRQLCKQTKNHYAWLRVGGGVKLFTIALDFPFKPIFMDIYWAQSWSTLVEWDKQLYRPSQSVKLRFFCFIWVCAYHFLSWFTTGPVQLLISFSTPTKVLHGTTNETNSQIKMQLLFWNAPPSMCMASSVTK